ncbi:MAG: efflux RND transporter permease subunit [Planctomycetota bacterium]|nr:efflux RND transporter permease subunit [Planctomycetota bacterium]
MKSFVRLCLSRPITTLTVHLLLILAGILSVQQLPLSALPNFSKNRINVTIPYPNASPTQVENEVVRPLEEALATLHGLEGIESESSDGRGRVTLRFGHGSDTDAIKVEIRERLARAINDLPVEDIERIRVRDGGWGPGNETIMEARISSPGIDLSENYNLLVDRIQRPLERIDGVGQVELDGIKPLEVKIQFRKGDLEKHGLSLGGIAAVINGSNVDASIGKIWKDGKTRRLRMLNAIDEYEDLFDLPINDKGLRLGQVAIIEKVEGEMRWGRHLNHSPAISLEVSQQSGANTVNVCRKIREVVEQIQGDPQLEGIDLLVWQDQGKMIESSIGQLRDAGIVGGGLALIVLMLFLRRISATFLVGMAIPISVLTAMAALHLMEMELNTLTLLALMLGVGMLVDTAVVVVESIVRRAAMGEDPLLAATRGTMEVATPVFAATLTTMVVFLPVIISGESQFSEHLGSVGIVISLTIGASLFVSLTLVPMVSARIFGKKEVKKAAWFESFRNGYSRFLTGAIRYKWLTLVVAAAATLSVMIPFQNGFRFDLSDMDWKTNFANVSYNPVEGLDFREMEKVVTQIEGILESNREVIGEGDIYSWFSDGNAITRVYPPQELATEEYLADLRVKIGSVLPKVPGFNIKTSNGWGWGGRGGGGRSSAGTINVRLKGVSGSLLDDLAPKVSSYLLGVEGVIDSEIPGRDQVDELRLEPNEDLLARLQVSGNQVARSVSMAFAGSRLSSLRTRSNDMEINLGLVDEETDSVKELKSMKFVITDDLELPIEDLGTLVQAEAPDERKRWDRMAYANISVQLGLEDQQVVQARVEEALAQYSWPVGYSWDLGEQWSGRWRNRESFGEGMYLSVFLVYMVLACLFESMRTPLVLMLSVFLAVPGVIWFLFLQGDNLDTPAAIGTILLSGIVVNNGIVLIDQVLRRMQEGASRLDAIISGSSDRLRPILITALTTILGLIPMAYATQITTGPQFTTLGKTIIGGLGTSTLLTLVVLPVVLTLTLKERRPDTSPIPSDAPEM